VSTAVQPATAQQAVSRPDAGRRPQWPVVPLVRRLHFYAGILVAPFLVLAALTGLLFAFSPQFDQMAYGDQLNVARVRDTPHPLAEQVRAAQAVVARGTLTSVIPPSDVDETTRVLFSLPELGEKERTVYVDPYTNEVRGALTTWSDESPLTTWLDDLHRNLHLGALGRNYSELAASWLWVITLGGLTLWAHRRRPWRRVRRVLLPDLTAGKGVRRTMGWHAATGVWLLAGLLILSATGLTWSRYTGGHFDDALTALNSHAPELETSLTGTTAPATPGGGHHGGALGGGTAADAGYLDHVVRLGRTAGLTGPIKVGFPADQHSAWSVSQVDNTWPVHYDEVAIDPVTSRVTAQNRWADRPVLAKLSKLGVQAHMGRLFGIINQILLAALAAGLLCVIVFGYRMWWQRRPTRTDRARVMGRPPARGGWRQLRLRTLVPGAVVVAAVGWAVPLLGLSLLAFLVIDAGVTAARRRPT
jgi:uncharacterized iron-regulated membrane protein